LKWRLLKAPAHDFAGVGERILLGIVNTRLQRRVSNPGVAARGAVHPSFFANRPMALWLSAGSLVCRLSRQRNRGLDRRPNPAPTLSRSWQELFTTQVCDLKVASPVMDVHPFFLLLGGLGPPENLGRPALARASRSNAKAGALGRRLALLGCGSFPDRAASRNLRASRFWIMWRSAPAHR